MNAGKPIFRTLVNLFFMLLTICLTAQNLTPEQIRQKMSDIRKSTNWNDPEAAKKANAQIKELSMQLMSGGNSSGMNAGAGQSGSANVSSEDAEKIQELNQSMAKHKAQVWEQIWESAAGGENADILLAKPLREEIVEEYKADDDKTIKSDDYLNEMTYLFLDLSMPGIDLVIDAMPSFQNIKILFITAKTTPSYTDLASILRNASQYPLEELYIINLKTNVSSLPSGISKFKNLKVLELFNNNISTLPVEISQLTHLETLTLDMNPLEHLKTTILPLHQLKLLGLMKTHISESELLEIKAILPNCKIDYP